MSTRLSSLDLFRKIPKDLTQATSHGGVLSIVVFLTLLSVLILEVWTYLAGETRSKIVLDENSASKININFGISFLELPCQFAEVEMWDYLGNARLDVTGNVEKKILKGPPGSPTEPYHGNEIVHRKSDGTDPVFKSDFVFDATAENFGMKLKQVPYTFVLFYVEWCMYCRLALPIWHNLGGRLQAEGLDHRIQIARIDCVAEQRLCADSKVAAFPTFMMFKDVHPLQREYHGHRTVDSFMHYIDGIIGNAEHDPLHDLKQQWHEGCYMHGVLRVNRVPGNFHVMAKSDGHSFNIHTTNTSHVVHQLTFGPVLSDKMMRRIPQDVQEHIDPLADRYFINHFGHMSHEHNIKVVSTHYEMGTLLGHRDILGYQLAVSNHQYDADPNVPIAQFSYDLSPTAVVISQKGRRWYEFVTSLCGIVGGMFTTFQLLNGVLGTLGRKVTGPPQEILSPSGPKRG